LLGTSSVFWLQGAPKGAVVRLTASISISGSAPPGLQRVEQAGILLAVEGVRHCAAQLLNQMQPSSASSLNQNCAMLHA
jgi:hypothetical protein